MDQSSVLRDVALLILGVAFGFLPWLFDKLDIKMPRFVYICFLVLSAVLIGWALVNLGWIEQIPGFSKRISLSISSAAIAACVLIFIIWTLMATSKPRDLTKFPQKPLESVSGKTFVGGTVEIDGKVFEYCTFKDVTLMYHGTDTFSLMLPTWQGSVYLRTDNKAIHDFAFLRSEVKKYLGGKLKVFDVDKDGNPHPIGID